MANSKHPQGDHAHDRSNPGEMGAFLLALVLVAALAGGFLVAGVAGLTMVMVALVPVLYIVLVTISVGR